MQISPQEAGAHLGAGTCRQQEEDGEGAREHDGAVYENKVMGWAMIKDVRERGLSRHPSICCVWAQQAVC
jgi:hypothetical protein